MNKPADVAIATVVLGITYLYPLVKPIAIELLRFTRWLG